MVEQAIKKLPEMQQQENEDCEWEVQLWAVMDMGFVNEPSMCGERQHVLSGWLESSYITARTSPRH